MTNDKGATAVPSTRQSLGSHRRDDSEHRGRPRPGQGNEAQDPVTVMIATVTGRACQYYCGN